METENRPENDQLEAPGGPPGEQDAAGKEPEIVRDERGRWPKGQSGNPTGRRKGSINLKDLLERVLLEADPREPQKPIVERFVKALIANAMRGNGTAIAQVCDRIAGKVKEKVEISRPDDWTEEFVPVEGPEGPEGASDA